MANKDILDEIIKPDGGTQLSCNLVTRTCEVTLIGETKGTGQKVSSEKLTYKDSYTLPEELGNGTIHVDRYRDSEGKTYETGEKVTLEKNKTFYVQHLISFFSDTEELKERACYIDHGEKLTLPVLEKKGYQFLGWKEKDQDTVYAGDSLGAVLKGYELYAVWSEPLSYQIAYEVEDHLVKIAENQVSSYQYGTETLLPDKMQVIVENGYEFKGWYLKGDPAQTLITKISQEQTGNLILKAKLSKADFSKPDAEKTSENGSQTGEEKNAETVSTADGTKNSETETASDKNTNSQTEFEVSAPDSLKQNSNTAISKSITTFWSGKVKYQVVSQKKKTVTVTGTKGTASSLTIPVKVRYQGSTYSVICVGKKAFYKNSTIKKLVISSGIQKIDASAFAQMKKLKQVTIGKGVTSIGKKAFYGDKGLKTVKILSSKLKTVQKTAFKAIGKKAVFKVPAGKKTAYKRILPM